MEQLIHYTLIFSMTLLIISIIQRVKFERKYALWIGIPLFLLMEVGTRIYLVNNFGRAAGLHSFDDIGLNMILIGAVVVLLGSLFIWYRQKRFLPWGILGILALIQIIICILFYTSTSFTNSRLHY